MELIKMSRQRLGATIDMLMRHVALKAHLLKIKITDYDICMSSVWSQRGGQLAYSVQLPDARLQKISIMGKSLYEIH